MIDTAIRTNQAAEIADEETRRIIAEQSQPIASFRQMNRSWTYSGGASWAEAVDDVMPAAPWQEFMRK